MGKVLMSGIVPKLSVPTNVVPLGDVAVGSSVFLNVGGEPREFLVVHRGLPSSMYNSSCDGIWLLMKDVYTYGYWYADSSHNQYNYSTVHSWLNNTFLNSLDSEVKNIVKSVSIPYSAGTKGDGGIQQLSTKAFLLSAYEVGFTWDNVSNSSHLPKDGDCLSYFSGATNAKRVAYLKNGNAATWWNRTNSRYYSSNAWYVTTAGSYGDQSIRTTGGYRPALILPYDAIVNNDGLIVG